MSASVQGASGQGQSRKKVALPVLKRVMDLFDRVSLASRLVSILLILLTICLAITAFTTRQLVSGALLDKTDTQLKQQAGLVINSNISRWISGEISSPLTSYYLQIRDNNSDIIRTAPTPAMQDGSSSQPSLPPAGSFGDFKLGQPMTVPASMIRVEAGKNASTSAAAAPWRVIAYEWHLSGTKSSGIFFVGLSLADVLDTSSIVSRYFLVVSFLVLALATALGSLAISRALSPLKKVEKTAARIAGGDLSSRVPSAPVNTEIGSLSASLNTMLAQIEQSFKEQERTTDKMKRFVSDASHELRTPLAAIHGYAELYRLQRESPGVLDRADEVIGRIETSSTRMAALVEQLLSLARLDEGRGTNMTDTVHLDGMLTDVSEDLHALDPDRPISLGSLGFKQGVIGVKADSQTPLALAQFSQEPLSPVSLTGDTTRLRQVFTNIVGNIHRYTPRDSPVQISLTVMRAAMAPEQAARLGTGPEALGEFMGAVAQAVRQSAKPTGRAGAGNQSSAAVNRYVFIRFADHGPGVEEKALPQLFERFYTADASRAREKGGTGLGMAIAKSVVAAHHGFICATQTQGGGLTINVVLPLVPVIDKTDGAGKTGEVERIGQVAEATGTGKAEVVSQAGPALSGQTVAPMAPVTSSVQPSPNFGTPVGNGSQTPASSAPTGLNGQLGTSAATAATDTSASAGGSTSANGNSSGQDSGEPTGQAV